LVKQSLNKLISEDRKSNIRHIWLDVDQAAEQINKTPRFVRRLIAERRIRYYKHGGFVAIRQTDLDHWAMSEPREPLR
jgi:excisionase family DNA binding protein